MQTLVIFAAAAGFAACALGEQIIAGPVISDEPTLITTREGLAAIANDLGGSYALGADIDLGGADWTPLGTESAPFTGEFHGNGHAIRNLVCTNNPSGNSCRGLFGCASNATIDSVSVSGTVAGKQYVGGLVGRVRGGTVVSNCSAAVEVAATGSYAGGLIGSCDGGGATNRIAGCRADGVTEGNGFVGGFVGYVYAPATISNCAARGDVRSAGSDYGGFVGRFAHASATIDDCWSSGAVWDTGGFIGNHGGGSIMDCYAEAEVEAGGSYVGGFAGFVASSARIAASWCSGQVDATDTYRGAFVGGANGKGLVSDSCYDTSANGQMEASGTSSPRGSAAYAGIAPLDADDMTDKASFPVFDFIDTWIITEADGAPQLRTFFSAYELWLKDAGIAYEPEPEELVNGIPAGLRYVYDIPSDATNLYALPGEPFFRVVTDASGNPCVKFRARLDPHDGVEAREIVEATVDLADWTNLVPMRHNAQDDTWKPDVGVYPDQMFFRWKIDLERSGD